MRPKYGIRLHTRYKLDKEELMYIVYMILVANISMGTGLLVGYIITLTL